MLNLHNDLNQNILRRVLACPVCGAYMHVAAEGRSLVCIGARSHCFDGGAGGYVPLAPRHPGGGDAKEAVRARTGFLSHGYYQPAAELLCSIAATYIPAGGCILDAGCGEGYYSCALADCGYSVLGVDLSKYAVDTAAKAARCRRQTQETSSSRTVFAVGSVFDLPVQDASLDGVTNIFAPCAPDEYARVLRPGGYLIVAGAGPAHLFGLKKLMYDDPYLNDPRRDLPGEGHALVCVDRQEISFTVTVRGREDLDALFAMTPYYWRTSQEGRERLLAQDVLETEVAFDFYIYRKPESDTEQIS